MKRIKTICKDINPRLSLASEVQEFDDAVNAALAEGWTLVKRGVLDPHVGEIYDYNRTFYAELEYEASCFNCANFSTEACDNCHLVTRDKWEPGEALAYVSPLKKR